MDCVVDITLQVLDNEHNDLDATFKIYYGKSIMTFNFETCSYHYNDWRELSLACSGQVKRTTEIGTWANQKEAHVTMNDGWITFVVSSIHAGDPGEGKCVMSFPAASFASSIHKASLEMEVFCLRKREESDD